MDELEFEPPKRKIELKYVKQMATKGKTYKQIAEHFGTTENYIKKIMYEDRKKNAEAEANKRPVGRPKGSKNKRTIAEEQMLANWENTKLAPMMREDKAELNRAAGWFVTECLKLGQTTNIENIDSLYNALGKYVELCTQTGMPMLVKTCMLALGIGQGTFTGWKNGTKRANNPRYKEFAEMTDAIIGAGMEAAAAAGSIDKVLTIWWEKAHFNMIEGNGKTAEQNDPLGERVSSEDIIKKYADLPD